MKVFRRFAVADVDQHWVSDPDSLVVIAHRDVRTDASGNVARKDMLVVVPRDGGDKCGAVGLPIAEGAQCE